MELHDAPRYINDIKEAFEDFPVLERLEFVKALICNKAHISEPPDPTLLIAMGVLWDTVEILRMVPQLRDLRGPINDTPLPPLMPVP